MFSLFKERINATKIRKKQISRVEYKGKVTCMLKK